MPDPAERYRKDLGALRAEVKRLRSDLERLTSPLETLLKRRGFSIYKQAPSDTLLVPSRRHLEAFYDLMQKYSFRLFLRDVIQHQDGFTVDEVARYATAAVTSDYIHSLVLMKLLRKGPGTFQLVRRPVRSFGPTLEWYVAELLRREFGCEAVWGVKFRRPQVGGDYDVLAQFNGALWYAEVKSSPPKQIYDSEVAAFLDRVQDLSPEISLFLMDTELRMKDKIVPMFEKELAARFERPPAVLRMERELFQINDRIFIINAREEVRQNIQAVFSWYYRRSKRVFEEDI
jgi:hypothetical protein